MKFKVQRVISADDLQNESYSLEDTFLIDERKIRHNGLEIPLHYGDIVDHSGKRYFVNEDSVSENSFENCVTGIWNIVEGPPPADRKRYLIRIDESTQYKKALATYFSYHNTSVTSFDRQIAAHAPVHNKYFIVNENRAITFDENDCIIDYDPTKDFIADLQEDARVKREQLNHIMETYDSTMRLFDNADEVLDGGFFIGENDELFVYEESEARLLSLKGEKGDTGDQGIQGETGDRGEKGEKGEKGDRGKTGSTGARGKTGASGERGLSGPAGPRGESGERGTQGNTGEKGEKGSKGEPGSVGPQGPTGPQGERAEEIDWMPTFGTAKEELWKNLLKEIQKLDRKMSVDLSNKVIAATSGGGSVNIHDMDDVVFTQLKDTAADSILIFDPTIRKYVATNFIEVLNNLKAELEVQYNKLIDKDGAYTYIGEASPGTAEGAAVWRIKRVEQIGDDYNILWADGISDFTKVWTSRLSYSYS